MRKSRGGVFVVIILLLGCIGAATSWLVKSPVRVDRTVSLLKEIPSWWGVTSPSEEEGVTIKEDKPIIKKEVTDGNVKEADIVIPEVIAPPVKVDWKIAAPQVLRDFFAAVTPEEKMRYCIPNKGVMKELKTYFPEGARMGVDVAAFSYGDENDTDRDRGIHLMRYSREAQGDIGEYFKPIERLEVVSGQVEPALVEKFKSVDVSELAEPLNVDAIFKQTSEGLKLDASVFIQSKFRTFKKFTEYPQPGKSMVFRVVVAEVLTHEVRNDSTSRAYRLSDYSYPQDFVNIPIAVKSDLGGILSVLDWRGKNTRKVRRAATVEIAWSNRSPFRLELKNVLCWEFIGVGGKLGNTVLEKNVKPGVSSASSQKVGDKNVTK